MLTFAPLFGSGCVLPIRRELRIMGESDAASVGVMLQDAEGHVLSAGCAKPCGGRFLALLPAVAEPCTGCRLSAIAGEETLCAEDVALGLVFLAGGQSNMELELQNADEGRTLIETHCDPGLRYFNVPKKAVWNDDAMAAEKASHWESIRPGMGRDMSAVAYFFAAELRRRDPRMPVGIVDCYWGGTSITCWMDEEALLRTAEGKRYLDDWSAASGDKSMVQFQAEWDAFQAEMDVWNNKCSEIRAREPGISWDRIVAEAGDCPWHPPVGPGSPYRPAGLYHTMLERIAPAALTGLLYYQGEEDAAKTDCYHQLLMQMVLRWRELFRAMDLPFVNMQLPMWIDRNAADDGSWARTRMAQQKARDMIANSALCCIIDCGEYDNIHPTDKRTPGERLARTWLAHAGALPAFVPEAVGKATEGPALLVQLSLPVHADGPLTLFEIADAQGAYVPAQAELIAPTALRLTAPGVDCPTRARYAYVAYAQVPLFGEDGTPLAPFALA